MLKRIFSTLILWTIIIFTAVYGENYYFSFLLYFLSALCIYESCYISKNCGLKPNHFFIQLSNFLFFSFLILDFLFFKIDIKIPIFILSAPIFLMINVFLILKDAFSDYTSKTIIPNIAIFMLSGFMFLMLSFISLYSLILVIWAIAVAKFSDVGGYIIGSAIGKHKMSPKISPNKTWEGTFGGILSSIAISLVVYLFFSKSFPENFTYCDAICWSIPLAVIAIMSDLIESVFKRRGNVKDSGKTIPGIGGALDLSDSIILTAPLSFFIFLIYKFYV